MPTLHLFSQTLSLPRQKKKCQGGEDATDANCLGLSLESKRKEQRKNWVNGFFVPCRVWSHKQNILGEGVLEMPIIWLFDAPNSGKYKG